MAASGIAKVQHYVPQFLLRRFGNGKKDQLNVFDKQASRSFPTNAKNVASESRFYDFRIEDQDATLEPKLAQLEGATKPLLERILDRDSTSVITDAERELLCTFLAVQFTRTKAFREQVLDIPKMLGEHLRSRSGSQDDSGELEQFIKLPDENQQKIETARFMMNAPRDFGPHFLNKDWLLVATTRKAPFIIGDNPLALQNTIDMGPYGNLGLAVKGIEMYLPLSPVRALAMWCPSHKQTILSNANTLRQMRVIAPHLIAEKIRDPGGIERLERALLDDTPLQYSLDNVRNFNSLQVRYAERFVFSSNPDFSLAHEMVNSHPALRTGMRMRSN